MSNEPRRFAHERDRRRAGAFFQRLILYAAVIGLASLIGSVEWANAGLDVAASGVGPAAEPLEHVRAGAGSAIAGATLVIVALGSLSRLLATFALFALAAAIVTAPVAIARAVGN